MKIRTILIPAVLATATALAAAAPPGPPTSTSDRALMVYFSKSFGPRTGGSRTPLAFGLRLQQSTFFDASRAYPLIDARYSLSGRRTLAVGGMLAFDSFEGIPGERNSWTSSDASAEHPGWLWFGIGLGALGLACAAQWGICQDDDGDGYDAPVPNTPTNPG